MPLAVEREPAAPRRIAHLDMDAFYASVEVRANPAFRGLPVIVGADPRGGHGRGIVTTCSYEARKFGVRSAMPISTAWRLCPQAVYVRPRFELYSAASESVFGILRERVHVVEAASVDEAYMDLTAQSATWADAEALLGGVQREIAEREGLTASVGLAPNKLVAKIASDFRKPQGFTLVRDEDVRAFLAPLPVRKLPGVGPKTDEALAAAGILTCADLAAVPPERLAAAFGAWGPRLAELALGVDDSRVATDWERKSAGAESTFMEDVDDADVLADTVEALAREAAEGLATEGLAARTITVKIRTAGFETFTRARTLEEPTADADRLSTLARQILVAHLPLEPVRLLGVRYTQLTGRRPRQLALDEWPSDVLGGEPAWRPAPRGLERFS